MSAIILLSQSLGNHYDRQVIIPREKALNQLKRSLCKHYLGNLSTINKDLVLISVINLAVAVVYAIISFLVVRQSIIFLTVVNNFSFLPKDHSSWNT